MDQNCRPVFFLCPLKLHFWFYTKHLLDSACTKIAHITHRLLPWTFYSDTVEVLRFGWIILKQWQETKGPAQRQKQLKYDNKLCDTCKFKYFSTNSSHSAKDFHSLDDSKTSFSSFFIRLELPNEEDLGKSVFWIGNCLLGCLLHVLPVVLLCITSWWWFC